MKQFLVLISGVFFTFILNCGFAQGNHSVLWHIEAGPVVGNETILTVTAKISPGWHLYSQHIAEGGPIPTRFVFNTCDDYITAGTTEEKGHPVTFCDDLYEMEITWYSEEVSFRQKIKLFQPATTVTGNIEYMTCNDHLCVPGRQAFRIDILSHKTNP